MLKQTNNNKQEHQKTLGRGKSDFHSCQNLIFKCLQQKITRCAKKRESMVHKHSGEGQLIGTVLGEVQMLKSLDKDFKSATD